MKKILIATLTPLLLTVPLITISPSFAEKSGGIIAQADSSIRQMAQGFTVKILVGDTNGSGVIIGKTGNTYRVVTNAHVVNRASSYRLQTPDGKVYQGKLIQKGASIEGNDLAILEFQAPVNYSIATLADGGTLKPNDAVYSAGFPIDQSNFVITSGTVTEVTSQPLKGGYQLGFSADTLQGMSGGPLLNASGQLIGIVGMGKGAALMEAYTYQDESRPGSDVINQWRSMSFAVPVATINQIAGDVAKVPSGEGQAVAQAKNYTGIVKKVDDIAQQVTVRIDYQENGEAVNGSGTIVGKEGNTYFLLTACHVVATGCKSENLMNNWVITMPDGEKIVVKSGKDAVTILNPAIDVAVIRFTSTKNYVVATIGNYTTRGKQWLFMAVFPGKDQSKQRLLTAGTLKAKDEAAFNTKDKYSMENGQELVYTNQSSAGMSGGGVFDTEGKLVGVNTGSEDTIIASEKNKKGFEEISLGYSLGVPIMAVLGIAEVAKFSTENFPKVANPAVEANANEIQQIKTQLFRFQIPQSGATVADWVNYGNSLWRAEEFTEAVKAFDLAISLSDKESSRDILAQIYYAKGLALSHFSQSLFLTNFQKAAEKREEALTAFQQATKTDSGFSNAWRWQGAILRFLKRYPEALIAYEQAITGDKTDFVPYVGRGNMLSELKRYPEALVSYERAINLKPTHPWAYSGRGDLYENKGEKELALKDYNQAIKLNPQDASVYVDRGILYKNKREKELALKDFKTAILIDPQSPFVYISRGLFYLQNGENELALKDYNQAIKLQPKRQGGYISRGLFYDQNGKNELAFQDYNQAILINPQSEMAYVGRGNVYADKGEKDLALKDFNKAISIDSQFDLAYSNRGNFYFQNGEKDLALQDYNQAIKLDPYDAAHYSSRGSVYFNKGEKDLALNDFNQAIKLDPQSAIAYASRGIFYEDKGEKELALQDYNQAAKLANPSAPFAIMYIARGDFYFKNGETELALKDYNKAIEIDPQNGSHYVSRGGLYSKKGETELALKDFNQAIKIDPQYAKAYFQRGTLYFEKGEKELALKDYNQAIKLNPEYANAYAMRGGLFLKNGEKELALKDYNQAIQLKSQLTGGVAEVYFLRGTIYLEKGDKELALKDFTQSIELKPQDASHYVLRGLIYYEKGDKELALKDFNEAIKLKSQDANVYYSRGLIYHEKREKELALNDYNQAIKLKPDFAEAYNNIGFIYYEKGEKSEAIQQFQKAISLNEKFAEPQLALAIILYQQGEVEKGKQLAQSALKLDPNFADPANLKKNLWGEKLINDTQQMLKAFKL
jgi:tetratricopeptide (TPR) repeat protein/S1-C subfamily serine protease